MIMYWNNILGLERKLTRSTISWGEIQDHCPNSAFSVPSPKRLTSSSFPVNFNRNLMLQTYYQTGRETIWAEQKPKYPSSTYEILTCKLQLFLATNMCKLYCNNKSILTIHQWVSGNYINIEQTGFNKTTQSFAILALYFLLFKIRKTW